MARRYTATGARNTHTTTANTPLTILGLAQPTTPTTRPRIYDVIASATGNPADNTLDWILQRISNAGTGTAVTPVALDSMDAAATVVVAQNHTAEPSYAIGTPLLAFVINQRSTFRWVAAPGSEIVLPATASNGVGLTVAGQPGLAIGTKTTVYWIE